MNSQQIIGLLVQAVETESKKHLPGWVVENWLSGFSELLEKGLSHAWLAIIEGQLIEITTDVTEIVDKRGSEDA
mgnify:CR=1 FL=1|tara:strand:- start:218 stop:439 length:222 start_codon:yes stop_codon:yes gene_type:complete